MRVRIRDVSRHGLDIVDQAMPGDLDLLEEFIDHDKPVTVRGHFERVDNFILARLRISYTADTVCSRCLDPVEGEVSFNADFDIEVRPGVEFFDLGARVREEILVGYAPRILCREDCKGICPGCGAYLNNEPCECDQRKEKHELK